MSEWKRPQPGQFDSYYQQYLDLVPPQVTDIVRHLKSQGLVVLNLMRSLDEEAASRRYAPDKWSVKEVVGHLIDTERLFAFRSLWLARGAAGEQPGMDENRWAGASGAHARSLAGLRREQHVCRTDHIYLWRSFDADMRERRGVCNGAELTAGAVPWLVAGHERHHLDVLRDRYGLDV
ncbi:hypothetical protein COW53_01290 [bacterium CG17_big_fil_post_rev_8_21_14_2_50_64_8]|nr:MAG: hypothetical protein COW53_01290 [bacterium CG17_big_fil_post_rev_8_21_14_2_50_64_8]PJA75940.1 MAG: hypothetical protein CO151_04550 [bacterium CG_4_9_14_3_um_filter_65_15]